MRRGIAIAVAGVLGLLVVTSAAGAAGGRQVQKPNTSAFAYLGKSHGYSIVVAMPTPRVAVLYVGKFEEDTHHGYTQSAYGVRVPFKGLEKGVVRASFPSMGRVSLRFEPRGKPEMHRLPEHCRGKRRVTERGRFRGTFSIEGEDGYFKLKGHSGDAMLERSFRLVCGKEAEVPQELGNSLWDYVDPGVSVHYSSSGGAVSLFYAADNEGSRTIGIRAAHYEGAPPGAELQLQVLERGRAGMAIGRSAFLESDAPETLTTSMPGVHPAFATLAPPAPFYGEGNYFENSSTSHSWTGTLGVSLPGLDLPLTGEQFKTSLCVVSPLKTPSGCDFIKPKPLVGARIGAPLRWRHP